MGEMGLGKGAERRGERALRGVVGRRGEGRGSFQLGTEGGK